MLQGMMDTWPVVQKNNCFLFPSQPELLKSRLEFIMPRLARNNMFSTKIILNADKEALSQHLAKASKLYEAVTTYAYTHETYAYTHEAYAPEAGRQAEAAGDASQGVTAVRTVVLIESEQVGAVSCLCVLGEGGEGGCYV
jgi:hypothetical protein